MPSQSGADEHPDIDDRRWRALLTEQARQNARLFFSLAFSIVGDTHAADDACQSAMLKAWTSAPRIMNPAAVKGWICRVIVNESLMLVRRRQVLERVFGKKESDGRTTAVERASAAPAPTPGEAEEGRETLLAALEKLPETMRLIVVLCDMHGETGESIAAMLGSSSSSVSKQRQKGRSLLRELLAGDSGAGPAV